MIESTDKCAPPEQLDQVYTALILLLPDKNEEQVKLRKLQDALGIVDLDDDADSNDDDETDEEWEDDEDHDENGDAEGSVAEEQ